MAVCFCCLGVIVCLFVSTCYVVWFGAWLFVLGMVLGFVLCIVCFSCLWL